MGERSFHGVAGGEFDPLSANVRQPQDVSPQAPVSDDSTRTGGESAGRFDPLSANVTQMREHSNASDQALARRMLQLGDKVTIKTVSERARAGTSRETVVTKRLEFTIPLEAGASRDSAVDAFLQKELGLSSDTVRKLSGGRGMVDHGDITSAGPIRYSLPLEAIETLAGMTWDAANPAVRLTNRRNGVV